MEILLAVFSLWTVCLNGLCSSPKLSGFFRFSEFHKFGVDVAGHFTVTIDLPKLKQSWTYSQLAQIFVEAFLSSGVEGVWAVVLGLSFISCRSTLKQDKAASLPP